MESGIADRLAKVNREFYQTFAAPFDATRRTVQPGARRLIERIPPDVRVADFGCGNGNAAAQLARRGFRGRYRGFDFSSELLAIAAEAPYPFRAEFVSADMTREGWAEEPAQDRCECGLAFAVLHHLPGDGKRRTFLEGCRRLLTPDGRLFLSTWAFARSGKLRSRTVPWSAIGLEPSDVDPGDFLMDWRREGWGLRYVHLFDEGERAGLADRTGFEEIESFVSDGRSGNLADYAVWAPHTPLSPKAR